MRSWGDPLLATMGREAHSAIPECEHELTPAATMPKVSLRRTVGSTAWEGEVHLGEGWLCFVGPLGTTEPHAHHAVQVVVATRPFGLQNGPGSSTTPTSAAVIPADAMHSLTGNGQLGWLLYLQHVRSASSTDSAAWAAEGGRMPSPRDQPDLVAWIAKVSSCLHTGEDDPAGFVGAAMVQARAVLPERVPLAEIARRVGVAPTTLSRRFTQVVGVPWRRWVLSERLLMAADALATGANLTEAAHRSGFADSPHLTRTFRRMFGIAPSDLTAVATWHVH